MMHTSEEKTETKDNVLPEKENRFWDRAKVKLEQCREESTRFLKVGKLKWDHTNYQRQRAHLYRRLGEKAYQLLKEGQFDPSDVQQLIERIDDLNTRISEHQEEIDHITKRQEESKDSESVS